MKHKFIQKSFLGAMHKEKFFFSQADQLYYYFSRVG